MTLRNLIRLDFYAMKPLAKIMLSFMIIPVMLGVIVSLETSIIVTLTFVVFMLNMIFAITEKSNFNKLYGILPMKRSTHVVSRYLFSIIIIGLTAIISIAIYIVLSMMLTGKVNWVNGCIFLTLGVSIAIFFICIQYPIYFRFEYAKATFMMVLPYVICFAIGSPAFSYLMEKEAFATWMLNLVVYCQMHPEALVCIGIVLCVVMIIASMAVSMKVQKKEF